MLKLLTQNEIFKVTLLAVLRDDLETASPLWQLKAVYPAVI